MAKTRNTAKRKTKKSNTAKKTPAKNSLVGNINKCKKAGTSRSKTASTISEAAYREMKQGWPNSKRKRAATKSSREIEVNWPACEGDVS
jgi:hypothetical protein